MMKKFTKKILVFLIPLLLFIVVTFGFYIFQKSKMNSELNTIAKEHKTLLMGDSQIQRLNPNYFKNKTYNFASTGEHYFFTYQKLLLITERENNVKNVVLGLSLHSFSPVYNRFFDTDFSEGKRTLKNNFYFLNNKNRKDFFEFSLPFTKEVIDGIYRNPIQGGLKESDKENPTSSVIQKSLKMYYSVKNDEEKISKNQIKYLKKIDSLCSQKNINLYLTTLPSHKKYLTKVDTLYTSLFYNTLSDLKTKKHLNFLSNNKDDFIFSDATHINKKGARVFSNKISEILFKD